ncbi:MAG TPA: hypothetical protein VEJ40_08755 [Pseudolabrys sp.]|nr:hypothetical protein [Pseudolabrys sp.]
MLKRPQIHAADCYRYAAECRQSANAATSAESRDFWQELALRWISVAGKMPGESETITPGEEHGMSFESRRAIFALLDVFDMACRALDLNLNDEETPRRIARAMLLAALDGEDDLEKLYRVGLKSVCN